MFQRALSPLSGSGGGMDISPLIGKVICDAANISTTDEAGKFVANVMGINTIHIQASVCKTIMGYIGDVGTQLNTTVGEINQDFDVSQYERIAISARFTNTSCIITVIN